VVFLISRRVSKEIVIIIIKIIVLQEIIKELKK